MHSCWPTEVDLYVTPNGGSRAAAEVTFGDDGCAVIRLEQQHGDAGHAVEGV